VSTRIFADAQASGANPLAAEHRAVMNTVLAEHGISPEAAAQMILEQMAAGQFWITTHPDQLREFATERADYLSALATPKISEAGRALLGLDS
jgi:hypothetical protein